MFGSQSDTRNKTEIVLSITPHLIRNIQRSAPADEAFWSGTEAVLRDRPLQLRSMGDESGGGAVPSAEIRTSAPAVTPASSPDAPKLNWFGPTKVKVGETFKLALHMESSEALRAASLQIAANTAEFELLSINEADYFNKDGKGAFNKSFDQASGRASVGAKAGDGTEVSGAGPLLTVTLKAKRPLALPHLTSVSIIAATPIGSRKAVGVPTLPAVHAITITE